MTNSDKLIRYASILAFALLFLFLIGMLAYTAMGQANVYFLVRIDNAGWFWTWHTNQPYTTIRALCFDDRLNQWCEPSLNFNRMTWVYGLINFSTGEWTTIYQLRRGQCIAWTWRPEYGTDGNPHIGKAELIQCL